jgi:hypothetical protein
VPEPITLTGTGDSVVGFEPPDAVCLVHVIGNAAAHHFAVTGYNEDGERVELLVNTTDPYDGYQWLDLMAGQNTTRFEVKADGSWTIEVIPFGPHLGLDFALHVPGTMERSGDFAFILIGEDPDTATIKGNAAAHHFAVFAYSDRRDLLVNTTDPYDGTVVMNRNTQLMQVFADGAWSIIVHER